MKKAPSSLGAHAGRTKEVLGERRERDRLATVRIRTEVDGSFLGVDLMALSKLTRPIAPDTFGFFEKVDGEVFGIFHAVLLQTTGIRTDGSAAILLYLACLCQLLKVMRSGDATKIEE